MPADDVFPSFFIKKIESLPLHRVLELSKAEIAGDADLMTPITGVASLDRGTSSEVSLYVDQIYGKSLEHTRVRFIFVKKGALAQLPARVVPLICADPKVSFSLLASAFYDNPIRHFRPDISEAAFVDPAARIGEGCRIDPGAVIEAFAVIGDRSWVRSHAFIGEKTRIGADCYIGTGASVSYTVAGNRVQIGDNTVIGHEGFGFIATDKGMESTPQIGGVEIGDDVWIGALCNIDRGSQQNTVIGQGTRLDSCAHIAHNVHIGRFCALAAQLSVAGSAVIEDFVQTGGVVGIAPRAHIGRGAKIMGFSAVDNKVPPAETWGGVLARPRMQYLREMVFLKKLAAPKGKKTADVIENN